MPLDLYKGQKIKSGTRNGTTSVWQNRQILKSIDCNGKYPLIKVIGDDIIVASWNGKLLVLDTTLNVKKQYNTINDRPLCLSATAKYIAIGTQNSDEVIFYDHNGSAEPIVRIKLKN